MTNPIDPTDLSLVTMDDIWEELKKRNCAVVLVDMRTLDNNREASQISFSGGRFTCLGLLEKAKAKILHDMLHDGSLNGE